MALADRSESLLEVNLGSIQKDPQQLVEGSEAGVMETIQDAIQDLDTSEALVIWVKPA
jgi:hypothetical protein